MRNAWAVKVVGVVAVAVAVAVAFSGFLPMAAASPSAAVTVGHSSKYPVPWDFLVDAALSASRGTPDAPPPGATAADAPCPAGTLAAHANPVVLVHGLLANEDDNWQSISPFLADYGYCVYALTYGTLSSQPPFSFMGGLTSMTASARQLADFVDRILADNPGVKKVDIVGHSEGGTMPDWYLKFDGGSTHVSHFVALSGVLHGTSFWGVDDLYALGQAFGFSNGITNSVGSFCTSCLQFLPNSTWMKTLDNPKAPGEAGTCPSDGAAVDGISYTSLATNNDELVRPPTSDFINESCNGYKGISVHNLLVQTQCPSDQSDHLSINSDPMVAEDILNALDPGSVTRITCTVVLPSLGTVVPIGG